MVKSLPDYSPANPAYRLEALLELEQALNQTRERELLTYNALATARDAAMTAEHTFYRAMQSVKFQVLAQYGDDSDAMQALGLKKRSKRLARRRAARKQES